ncbi:hypothetical protein [Paraburkholderia caballeronis]|uniref:Uncharacterized protein n=1 Tax=Paraburkholderia caballeronis TaxID=416943 RepID=A0A1H7U6E9_9BURK|nr:hypothetical protein [Paraburkholderia caballeronis]PXW23366.1 hypothetical protein C7403_110104 [Paraburkholderia caballeronis]PXW98359.1 hypothetical protein C7407_110104 [Paraburkholderia caballeronis]RAJ95089.1 hypothetical protein C7409_110104 [Paraburkholderia caballeronis]TDV39581.1 hypothetical protein C7405_101700 [Paraburkholderia caballeronis]SEC57698.1 hypothetical protein SAMN05445871_2456 [Paraburkholderia caballeronis]
MSTRTLLEINHDFLHNLRRHPEILGEIMAELVGSVHGAALNEANSRGHALDLGHGVRLVLQRHHSNDASVKTEYAEVRL